MALSGSYTLVKSEGLKEHLTADGVPEEFVKKAEDHEKKLEISVSGDKVTIKRPGDRRPEQTLILNQEVEEKFGENRTVKIKAVLNGDVLTVEAQGSHSFKKVYSVSGSELTVTLSSLKTGVPDAKRIYKKD